MVIDFSPVVDGILSTAITVAGAAFLAWWNMEAKKHALMASDAARDIIDEAVHTGGLLAMGYIHANVDKVVSKVDVHNEAIALGVQHVLTSVPETLAKEGVTTETITNKVVAQIAHSFDEDHAPAVMQKPVVVQGSIVSLVPGASKPLDLKGSNTIKGTMACVGLLVVGLGLSGCAGQTNVTLTDTKNGGNMTLSTKDGELVSGSGTIGGVTVTKDQNGTVISVPPGTSATLPIGQGVTLKTQAQ